MKTAHSLNPLARPNSLALVGASLLLAATPQGFAAATLTSGHADVGILYESGAWDLHVHDETEPPAGGTEYATGDAILEVGAAAQTLVPSNPLFSFLGLPGSTVHILPQNQNPSLLFLGLGTEEQASGVFVGDDMALALVGVDGPGDFSLYQADAFGVPTVFMNSADGVNELDRIALEAGSHAHANWAFTAPGLYEISFRASGVLNDGLGTISQSAPVTYTFSVVPEPGTWTLLGVGALALAAVRRCCKFRRMG